MHGLQLCYHGDQGQHSRPLCTVVAQGDIASWTDYLCSVICINFLPGKHFQAHIQATLQKLRLCIEGMIGDLIPVACLDCQGHKVCLMRTATQVTCASATMTCMPT